MKRFAHKFVEFMPERLEPNVLYVSIRFSLVSHSCACGCGEEVVTPLSPRDWQLIFNGETVSLYPSIGNWSFRCRSHYWIEQNRAVWIPERQTKAEDTTCDSVAQECNQQKMSMADRLWAKITRRFRK
jgi:hypothetical protein